MRRFHQLRSLIVFMILLLLLLINERENGEIYKTKSYDKFILHNQRVSLIAYSNKIIKESCYSIETAVLSGFTYSLYTKYNISTMGKVDSTFTISPLVQKIFGYYNAIKDLKDEHLVIFADAFDVIFQGNIDTFLSRVDYLKKSNIWDYTKTLLYNAEPNCHPFNVISKKYNCPLTQGEEYLRNSSYQQSAKLRNSVPIGCKLQISLAPQEYLEKNPKMIFFNSGVSVGSAGLYRKLFQKAIKSTLELPQNCLEDQGILGWLYANQEMPILLDFNSTLLTTTQVDLLSSYSFNQTYGTWQKLNGESPPFVIHFAGSKRAYRTYWQRLRLWHLVKLSERKLKKQLQSTYLNLNGLHVPYYDVCPIEKFSFWKSTIITIDKILKRIGLSPIHPPPEGCPREYCPREKTGPLPEVFP